MGWDGMEQIIGCFSLLFRIKGIKDIQDLRE